MAIAQEPPVRVRTGSVEVKLDSQRWSRVGPWKWRRTGEESEKRGELWIELNRVPVPHGSNEWVQLTFSDGALFFRYEGKRTVLRATYAFELSADGTTLTYPPAEQRTVTSVTGVSGSADGLEYTPLQVAAAAK